MGWKRYGLMIVLISCLGIYSGDTAEPDASNVVVVLDASGSMSGTMSGTNMARMDAAQSALKEVMGQIDVGTNVGLLVFSGQNKDSDWVFPLGPQDQAALFSGIDRLRPGGGTPLGAYIKMAADRLLEQRAEQRGYGQYRLLIVTDGQASDPALVERYVPDVLSRGIVIDVIGVDMASDHTLATRVHSYRRANDPHSLKQAIAEVFAEVGTQDAGIASEEAFELLAPIPVEMAGAMLESLRRSGNQPIGEGVGAAVIGSASVGQTPPRQRTPPPPASRSEPSSPTGSRSSKRGVSFGNIVFLVIILSIVFSRFSKGRRRRH